MSQLPAKPRVAKHLMTPGQPPRVMSREPMSITSVQRWVMSVIALGVILLHATFMTYAATLLHPAGRQIGMLVIAAAFGVLAVLVALLIHQRRWLSPWLLAGLLPALGGAWWIFWR